MELDQNTFELVEDYLEGKLTGVALSDFDRRLTTDPAFRALVDTQKEITIGIKKSAHFDLKKKLDVMHQETVASTSDLNVVHKKETDNSATHIPKETKTSLYKIISIAASVLFLLGLGLYFYSNDKSSSNNEIANTPDKSQEEKYATSPKRALLSKTIIIQQLEGDNFIDGNQKVNIKVYPHDKDLAYVFDGTTILLFTNPQKLDSKLAFFQISDQLILRYNNKHYSIQKTSEPKTAEEIIDLAPQLKN